MFNTLCCRSCGIVDYTESHGQHNIWGVPHGRSCPARFAKIFSGSGDFRFELYAV